MLFGKKPAVEWIAVFLGNPGPKYENTRHNAGFMAGAAAEKLFGVRMNRLRHRALTARADVDGHGLLLMEPQTYMNLSGEAVSRLVRWYRLPPENLMVVYDDVDLPQGAIRIRKNGSAGTHNGMRSIVGLLGYENFPRLRVGVGQRRPGYELADWVLGHYLPGEEQQTADAAYALAADAIIEYITNGIESAMCKYNTKKTKKPPEPAEGADA